MANLTSKYFSVTPHIGGKFLLHKYKLHTVGTQECCFLIIKDTIQFHFRLTEMVKAVCAALSPQCFQICGLAAPVQRIYFYFSVTW